MSCYWPTAPNQHTFLFSSSYSLCVCVWGGNVCIYSGIHVCVCQRTNLRVNSLFLSCKFQEWNLAIVPSCQLPPESFSFLASNTNSCQNITICAIMDDFDMPRPSILCLSAHGGWFFLSFSWPYSKVASRKCTISWSIWEYQWFLLHLE